MRGGTASMIRTGVLMAVALSGAAVARAQLPTVSIDDARVLEGNGPWTLSVTVTLSSPSASDVDVPWKTADGSALTGVGFANGSGSVHFAAGATTGTLLVTILGNTTPYWSPTAPTDRAFFIDLDPPTTANATLLKRRATVTIVDDDRSSPGLQLVSAVADGSASGGRVRLQWRVPASTGSGPPTDVLVRWNTGLTCSAPADTVVPATGEFRLSDPPVPIPVNQPGETQIVEHTGLSFGRYWYALFAIYSPATPTTERATIVATPFDATAAN